MQGKAGDACSPSFVGKIVISVAEVCHVWRAEKETITKLIPWEHPCPWTPLQVAIDL
jgi:hypothetical protein